VSEGILPKKPNEAPMIRTSPWASVTMLALLLVVLYPIAYDLVHSSEWLIRPVISLGWIFLGIGCLSINLGAYIQGLFPNFLIRQPRARLGLILSSMACMVIGSTLFLTSIFGLSIPTLGLTTVSVAVLTPCAVIFVQVILEPSRYRERQRRQKLLASIEALADDDPKLYAVAQLVRDDITISSRQSSLQSWIQSALFFVAGLAVPYVLQLVGPYLHNLFR
jgi:hypothetical protein